jgi:protein gp37
MSEQWVWDIKMKCQEQEVVFFFKQWGGINKKKPGRELAGMTYNDMPTSILFS